VLYSGVACITDLMVKEGLINLDFADVRSVMREMGRAMMGTGEASGQGRAMQAAEAAIANPLLDETSMKGAQGLLISITGGRDLTLFEVDEAATRIREEVDPDANIILGATFDESLEGIIRVSVVATGIDRAMNEAADRGMDFRPVAKPAIRPSAAAAPVAAAAQPVHVAQAHTAQAAAPAPRTVDPVAQTIRAAEADLERELEIQMARQAHVQQQQPIAQEESFRPQSRIFASAPEAQPVRQAPVQPQPAPVMHQQPIIRQAPEQVRMPKVEDFPPVVKAEMEHRAQPAAPHAAEERGPMGLLKRITNSLGRREEDPAFDDMMAPTQAAAPQQRRAPSPEASLYAPRRGNLDDQGRQVPQARMASHEDDQLEIPAFLRRQSN
ncbi:cell division protein FtsZ, partial [Rhizobium sp. NPDC092014]